MKNDFVYPVIQVASSPLKIQLQPATPKASTPLNALPKASPHNTVPSDRRLVSAPSSAIIRSNSLNSFYVVTSSNKSESGNFPYAPMLQSNQRLEVHGAGVVSESCWAHHLHTAVRSRGTLLHCSSKSERSVSQDENCGANNTVDPNCCENELLGAKLNQSHPTRKRQKSVPQMSDSTSTSNTPSLSHLKPSTSSIVDSKLVADVHISHSDSAVNRSVEKSNTHLVTNTSSLSPLPVRQFNAPNTMLLALSPGDGLRCQFPYFKSSGLDNEGDNSVSNVPLYVQKPNVESLRGNALYTKLPRRHSASTSSCSQQASQSLEQVEQQHLPRQLLASFPQFTPFCSAQSEVELPGESQGIPQAREDMDSNSTNLSITPTSAPVYAIANRDNNGREGLMYSNVAVHAAVATERDSPGMTLTSLESDSWRPLSKCKARSRQRVWRVPPGKLIDPQRPEYVYYLRPPGGFSLEMILCMENVRASAASSASPDRSGKPTVYQSADNTHSPRRRALFSYTARSDGRGGVRFPAKSILGRKYQTFNDVPLEAKRWFSRRHCVINWISYGLEAGEVSFTIRDYNSANGTYLNGRKVTAGGETALQSGDVIGVAMTESGELMMGFRFRIDAISAYVRGTEPTAWRKLSRKQTQKLARPLKLARERIDSGKHTSLPCDCIECELERREGNCDCSESGVYSSKVSVWPVETMNELSGIGLHSYTKNDVSPTEVVVKPTKTVLLH